MFVFTLKEKRILLTVCVVFWTGLGLQTALRVFPYLRDGINLIDGDRLYLKVDLNTADQAALERIPYIGTYTAGNIVAYRNAHGIFDAVEDVKHVSGIRDKNFARFAPYLKVGRRL